MHQPFCPERRPYPIAPPGHTKGRNSKHGDGHFAQRYGKPRPLDAGKHAGRQQTAQREAEKETAENTGSRFARSAEQVDEPTRPQEFMRQRGRAAEHREEKGNGKG